MMPYTPGATVGDLLNEDPDLSTFNQLIRRSGVIKKLDEPGPFTVLAPTNAAFELLPRGAIGALVDDPRQLERTMSYHVVTGAYRGGSLREFDRLPTLYGQTVSIVVTGAGVVVGGAGLEETDIPAANGLVHKVSNVMFPE